MAVTKPHPKPHPKPIIFLASDKNLWDLALFLLKFVRDKKISQRYPRYTETVENMNVRDADPQCFRYDRVERLVNKLGLAQTVKFIPKNKSQTVKFIPKNKSDHEKILPTFSVK